MLYEMLSGKRPFEKEREQALIYSILNDKQTPLSLLRSDIPSHIEQVIEKTLAKKASERYPNIQDLILAVESPLSINLPKTTCSISVDYLTKWIRMEPQNSAALFFSAQFLAYCHHFEEASTRSAKMREDIRGEKRFKKLMERVKHEWESFEV